MSNSPPQSQGTPAPSAKAQDLLAARRINVRFAPIRRQAEEMMRSLQPYLNPPAFDPVQMGAAIADGFKNARRLNKDTAEVLGCWGEWTLADREAAYQHHVLDRLIALRKAIRAVEQGALPRPVDGLPKEARRRLVEMRNTWAFGGELFPPEEMLRLFTPAGAVGGAKLGGVKAENAHLVAWGFMTRVDGCADEADVLWFGQSRGPKPPSEGRPALEKLNSVLANSVGGFKDAEADDLFVMMRVEQSVAIARYPQTAAPATPVQQIVAERAAVPYAHAVANGDLITPSAGGEQPAPGTTATAPSLLAETFVASISGPRQRMLLRALNGKGNVPIADVLHSVYGSKDDSNLEALLKAKDRVNALLATENAGCELRREGETLILSLL
jgi:hypothetical protein